MYYLFIIICKQLQVTNMKTFTVCVYLVFYTFISICYSEFPVKYSVHFLQYLIIELSLLRVPIQFPILGYEVYKSSISNLAVLLYNNEFSLTL